VIAAGLAAWCSVARGESIREIPDPRRGGSCVVDLTGTLQRTTIEGLNKLCGELATQKVGEMVIAVIYSTGKESAREYATQLFDLWRLGTARHDRGLLLLIDVHDRAAEAIFGPGVGADSQGRTSDAAARKEIIAGLESGYPNGAILRGANMYAGRLSRPLRRREQATQTARSPPTGLAPGAEPARTARNEPSSRPYRHTWISYALLVIGLLIAFRACLRRRPRHCPKCGQNLTRLTGAARDDRLTKSQHIEERLGSVAYDVWLCPDCSEMLQVRHGSFLTQYRRCPGCGYKTLGSSTRRIRLSTFSREGLVEINERCDGCGYDNKRQEATPRENQ